MVGGGDDYNKLDTKLQEDGVISMNNIAPSRRKKKLLSLPDSRSVFPRWLHDPFFPGVNSGKFTGFPRAIPLFKHLFSFTSELDIARNGIVED